VHQVPADVRVNDDRISLLVRSLWTRKRTTLNTLLRVKDGVLVGDLADRQALHANAQTRLVHHHEHRLEAAILGANQDSLGIVVVHDAGGVAVNAHLFLDGAAGHTVLLARIAISIE